jgi:hypothetical protein
MNTTSAPDEPGAPEPIAPPPPALDDLLEPAEPPEKPKTDVKFFLLGLFTPVVLELLTIPAWFALDSWGGPVVGVVNMALPVLFLVFLFLFLWGKSKQRVQVWSYGKGGMWAYAAYVLVALLAFGTCIVGLQG